MTDDHENLRHYAITGAEDAFATVVRHYLPLVYGAALRRVGGDTHRAQDVAQLVFTALARNARAVARHPDLAGWLFTTTRFVAAKTLRGERRRAAREHAVSLTSDTMSPEPSSDASALHAVLDDVLMELRQIDRQVILLRFHRGLRLSAIGTQLGLSENAVQKRLERALDQLREKLARRRITSSAAALAAAFEQQAAIALPSGLAASTLTASLAGSAAAGGLLAGSSLVAMSKLQATLAAALILALGATLFWQVRENRALRAATNVQHTTARDRVAALEHELANIQQRTQAVEADAAKLEAALRSARASTAPRSLTDDRARMDAAMKQGNQLTRDGKLQEALDTYLECYRALTRERGAVQRQMLANSIQRLGEKYPPALAALHTLRDAEMQKIAADPNDKQAVFEVGFLNERLGDSRATIALYDSLPQGHAGRQGLALSAQKAFVEARRYHDALLGESFGSMLNNFDRGVSDMQRQNAVSAAGFRGYAINEALIDIEVLTGAGRSVEAKQLTEKLLAFDNSEATRAALQRHIERATSSPRP